MFKFIEGIRQQILAFVAKTTGLMMSSTEDLYHLPNNFLFPFNSVHKHKYNK